MMELISLTVWRERTPALASTMAKVGLRCSACRLRRALEHAKEISGLNEKSYDELQRAHGKPLGERFASQDLYYDLGVAYGSLGRYTAALEPLRYGRGINPGRPDFYVALSAAYTGLLQPEEAAVALLES